MAMDGDLDAMRLVLETVCGNPNEAAPEHPALDLELPKLGTAENCTLALDRVAAALRTGACSRDAAQVLVEAIHLQMKALQMMDLERRLAELERRNDEGDWWKRG